ncbi:MAG: RNA polymerase subunit sigma-24 [Planctomycetota bacterium]
MNDVKVPCLTLAILLLAVTTTVAENAYRLAMIGGQLTSEDKDQLEKQVVEKPDDVESRTKLLGYYLVKGRMDSKAKSAKQGHVQWLIENAPDSEVLGLPYGQINKILNQDGYKVCKQAWLKVIEGSPEDLLPLKNASRFFLLHDREISEGLLLRGQKLDEEDPEWSASLGRLYSLEMSVHPQGPVRVTAAKKAFRQFKSAHRLSDPNRREVLLSDLAKTAIEAGLIDEAKKYATNMVEIHDQGWNRGNRTHHGNLILGRVALVEGNVNAAKTRLILAGETEGSPQLDSFGPNMQLAKQLIERGEREVVLEYFTLCKKFWKLSGGRLERWTEDVKANRDPQFGANLNY